MLLLIASTILFVLPSDGLDGIEELMKRDPPTAFNVLQKAAEDEAARPRAVQLLATLCNRSGDIEGALRYGEQATQLLPETSDVWLQYAIAMRNKFSQSTWYAMTHAGDYRRVLNVALALDPHNYHAWSERIAYLILAPSIAGGSKAKARQVCTSR